MTNISERKLAGICIIVGPVLALVFFLLSPGIMIIDPVETGDARGLAMALAENATLSHIVAFLVAIGLAMSVFGLYVVQHSLRDGGPVDGISRLGFFCILLGMSGWIVDQGIDYAIADEGNIETAISIVGIGSSVSIISTFLVSCGFLFVSLALAIRGGIWHRALGSVAAAGALVSVVCLLIGGIPPSDQQIEVMITISRSMYFVWVVWLIFVGVTMITQRETAEI